MAAMVAKELYNLANVCENYFEYLICSMQNLKAIAFQFCGSKNKE